MSKLRKEIIAALLVALMILPLAIGVSRAAPQSDGTIPDLDSTGIINPLLNIGPGKPVVVAPGESFEITLKGEYTNYSITAAKLVTVKLAVNKLVKTTADLVVTKINDASYNLTLPSTIEPGLYDLILYGDSEAKLISPRSVWVITSPLDLGEIIRFLHITDVHFGTGFPDIDISQNRRFTGYLFGQLAGATAILNTGDEADTNAPSQYMNSLAYRYAFAYPLPMVLNPGNHDYPNGNYIRYYEETTGYTVISNKILVAFINSDGDRGYPDWGDLSFLNATLAKYRDIPYKIVMVHHPVFYYQGEVYLRSDENTSLLDDPRTNSKSIVSYYWGANLTAVRYFLKLCEDYNVTLVLAGHIHRDQYVAFHSTRTNTTTLFQTTTTLAIGTATYQGLQVVDLNMTSGKLSYPLAPPWFIGYNNASRSSVYNSIPITLPQYTANWDASRFNNITFYGALAEGKKAIILTLTNNLPYIDFNRTLILALPWPSNYNVNLMILDSRNNSNARILDQMRVDEVNRTFVALHLNLPRESMIKVALYTLEDNDPPEITVKSIIPQKPSVNQTVKLYLQISDPSWGVESTTANITASSGNVKVFKFEKYGGDIYLVQFIVESSTQSTAILKVIATDYAGHTAEKTASFDLAGPAPQTTTTATQTTQTTTTMTHTSTTSVITTTTPVQTQTSTTLEVTTTGAATTTPAQEGGMVSLIMTVLIALFVIAVIALIVKR